MDRRSLAALLCPIAMAFSFGCSGSGDPSEATGAADEEVDGCSARTEVILWTEDTTLIPIARGLAKDKRCTDYYIAVPLQAADKTNFHPNVKAEIDQIHKLGSNFHALAEFEWGAWGAWVAASPGTRSWREAALAFRAKMDAAGFTFFTGNSDTWIINEFPSTMIDTKNGVDKHDMRAHALAAVGGLYDGGNVRKKGGIARAGHGSNPGGGIPQYKGMLQDFLTDEAFWNGMSQHVRWWGEEVYSDPHDVCVGSATVAERSRHLNDYAFHLARLAAAGPASAGAARAFFAKAFTPWLNGAWQTNGGYGDVRISQKNMAAFLAQQVYSVHTFGENNSVPAQRIAWSWSPNPALAAPADQVTLSQALAYSINNAYASNASSNACSPTGAYTNCQCDVDGAAFTEIWHDTFGTW